jgi:hypothetical protein
MMFGVAVLASLSITLKQDSMQGSWILNLGLYIRVAAQASVWHGLVGPEGHVALATVLSDAGMGSDPGILSASLGIEITRVEHGITRNDLSKDQNDQCDECTDQGKWG